MEANATAATEAAPAQETPVDAASEPTNGADLATEGDTPPWKATKPKVKIAGQELEVDYDDLVKSYQLDKAITQKSQAVAEERRQARAERDALASFLEQAKTSPKMIFEMARELGHDPQKLAEDLLWEQIQYQKLSQPEKDAMAARQKAEAAELELKTLKQQLEAVEMQKVEAQAHDEIEDDIIEAIKLSGKKPNKYLVARAAEIYQNGFKANGTKLGREAVAKKLSQWIDQEFDGIVDEEPSALVGRLSPSTLKKLKDHFVKEAMATKQAKLAATHTRLTSTASNKQSKIGIDDYFSKFGK